MTIASLTEIGDQDLLDLLNNSTFGSAGLAEGSGPHTVKTTIAVHYRIAGQAYAKAVTDSIAWPTALVTALANGVTAYYLITINAAGALAFTFPPAVRAGDPDTTGLLLGLQPAASAVLGIMKLVTTAAFTHGTTDLGGQGTFANINFYPANGDPTVFTYA
jgi:hypothetical protein